MTSMTRRKRKTGTRKDGWRNKIKKLGKFMKKRKENVLWTYLTGHIIMIPESEQKEQGNKQQKMRLSLQKKNKNQRLPKS